MATAPKPKTKPPVATGGKPTAEVNNPKTTWKDNLRNLLSGNTTNDVKQKIADKASEKLSSGKFKDNSKILASRLINLYMKQESTDDLTKTSPPPKILKGILKLMVETESQRKIDSINDLKTTKLEERQLEKRHREIIKALTIRFKPTKKVTTKKEEPKTTTPTPGRNVPTTKGAKKGAKTTTTTKPTQTKPSAETPKVETPKTTPKVETPKVETPKTTPKTAETVKPVETPKTAEPIKTVETAPSAASVPSVPSPSTSTVAKMAVGGVTAATATGALAMPSQTVADAIKKASNTVGVGLPLMYAIAKQESGFDPSAGAKTSSAKGLYQFVKGTWASMVKNYGSKYPILKSRGPNDVEANALAGALYIKENSEVLKKANIPINATTIYSAHFLGAGGAKQLYSLPPDSIASQVMPKAAAANGFIFYKKGENGKPDKNQPRTVREVKNILFEKVGQFESRYAEVLNVTTGTELAKASVQNEEMKVSLSDQTPSNKVVNNISESQVTQQQKTTKVADDRSPYERVAKG